MTIAVALSSVTLTACHELWCAFVEGLTAAPIDCSHDDFPDLGDIPIPSVPPPPPLPTTSTMPPPTTSTTMPEATTTVAPTTTVTAPTTTMPEAPTTTMPEATTTVAPTTTAPPTTVGEVRRLPPFDRTPLARSRR